MNNQLALLTDEQLKKTSFGLVESLDKLFSGYAYSKRRATEKHGSHTPRPNGFVFLASRVDGIHTWGDKNMDISLGVKALPHVDLEIKRRCCEGFYQSLEIVPWRHAGVALIHAIDRLYIASPWVAFVPLEALPAISISNTPLL